MEASFLQRHPVLKDVIGVLIFIICVVLGTIFINTFIFRSYNVVGPSMESTLYTNDRLIVSRLPATWAQILNKEYVPERGQIIVFKNPRYNAGTGDEYIVKRVIAFPGERVTIEDGRIVEDGAHDQLGDDEQLAGVHPVRHHAGVGGEKERGEELEGCGDADGGGGVVREDPEHQPVLGHTLHPGPGVGDEGGVEPGAVAGEPEGVEGGAHG